MGRRPGSGPPPAANSLLPAKSVPFPGQEEECSAEKRVSAPSCAPAHTYKFWLTLILFFKDSNFLFCFVMNKNKKKKKKVAIFFSVSFS